MTVREVITAKLGEAFAPASLDVIDESDRHVGHAGYRAGGETHFRIHIVSEAFRGKSRLERHRMIYNTLADELKAGVHALAIEATTPSERAACSAASDPIPKFANGLCRVVVRTSGSRH